MSARLVSVFFVGLLGLVHLTVAQTQSTAVVGQAVACASGNAAGYGCSNVDLQAFMPLSTFGSSRANDIWGWVDPETQREYALVGLYEGTAFVDVTDPVNPVYLGKLPTHSVNSSWRDIKVYADHAFIVSEASDHGMQVFDLTQLRSVTNAPMIFSETAHYNQIAKVHNIVINEDTGFAYTVGNNGGGTTCGGSLHMINIQDPLNPTFVGCFADPTTGLNRTGYTHDAQCVAYHGPDTEHQGKEICFGANETALSIADVTDKAAPFSLATGSYPTASYIHQGWLTGDHAYYYQDDELDNGITRTLIWDVSDLDDPILVNEYSLGTTSRDHNLYIVGDLLYEANYTTGLHVFDISDRENPVELGFFDTYTPDNSLNYEGAWSNYPFFPSGNVVISSMGQGLFVVRPTAIQVATETEDVPESFVLSAAYPNPFNPETTVTVTLPASLPLTVGVYDVLGRRVALLFEGMLDAGTHPLRFNATGLSGGTYVIRAESGKTIVSRQAVLVK